MLVEIDAQSSVATLELQDPERKNTLSTNLLDDLLAGLQQIEAEHHGNVVVLKGAGKVFCSGIDLDQATGDTNTLVGLLERLGRVVMAIKRLPQVVVVQVQGAALAGGCAIMSAADVACIEESAKVGYPVLRIGLSAAISLPTLIPAVGPAHARELLLTGSIIDGRQALRMGLADRIAPSRETLEDMVRRIGDELSTKGTEALRRTKAWLNDLEDAGCDRRFSDALSVTLETARSEEAASMLEAHWSDRRSR